MTYLGTAFEHGLEKTKHVRCVWRVWSPYNPHDTKNSHGERVVGGFRLVGGKTGQLMVFALLLNFTKKKAANAM